MLYCALKCKMGCGFFTGVVTRLRMLPAAGLAGVFILSRCGEVSASLQLRRWCAILLASLDMSHYVFDVEMLNLGSLWLTPLGPEVLLFDTVLDSTY